MRRPITFLVAGLLAVGLSTTAFLATTAPASAATTIAPATTCSNGVDNTGGLGLICEVTIVNRMTLNGGSATVTVRECHGAAGVPETACSTTTDTLSKPVSNVTQCNDSINGGGGTLRCSVRVVNEYVGIAPGATAVTVNQCVGSADGIANTCDPFPATTSGAAITQCNGSANGGTLVGLTCTATGTMGAAHRVRINQCNGSANGGGSLVICSARIVNRLIQATAGTGGATPTPAPGRTSGLPNTTIAAPTAGVRTAIDGVALTVILLLGSVSLVGGVRRFGSRGSR